MKVSQQHKKWLILPALIWLITQFAMTGALATPSTDTLQVTLCTPYGAQEISIDLETGEPVKNILFNGCEWCQSFDVAGVVPVLASISKDIIWVKTITQISEMPDRGPLWSVSGFQSRAPPL